METYPLVSFCVIAYKEEKYIEQAIQAAFDQDYPNMEIILSDDGSPDNTFDIMKKMAANYTGPHKIILNKNTPNLGPRDHYCKVLYELSHGDIIVLADGDDISLPTRFEKQVNFLDEHPEYAVVSAPMIYFDEEGEFRRGIGRGEIKAKDFVYGSPICHAPCMVRSEVMKSVGGYSVDSKLLRVEDYHLWFKIFAAGHKLYMMNECLYKMRDDKNAYQRRTLKSRFNEAYVKKIGFQMIKLPFYYQVFVLRPILIGLLPKYIYMLFHK